MTDIPDDIRKTAEYDQYSGWSPLAAVSFRIADKYLARVPNVRLAKDIHNALLAERKRWQGEIARLDAELTELRAAVASSMPGL